MLLSRVWDIMDPKWFWKLINSDDLLSNFNQDHHAMFENIWINFLCFDNQYLSFVKTLCEEHIAAVFAK